MQKRGICGFHKGVILCFPASALVGCLVIRDAIAPICGLTLAPLNAKFAK